MEKLFKNSGMIFQCRVCQARRWGIEPIHCEHQGKDYGIDDTQERIENEYAPNLIPPQQEVVVE